MGILIFILLPMLIVIFMSLHEKLTTTPEQKAKMAEENEMAIALKEAQDLKDEKKWKEKRDNDQGWANEQLDGEYHFMSRIEKEKYLNSSKWKLIKNAVINRDNACVSCSRTEDLNVHHLHYLRLGRENLNDLVALCSTCHSELHAKLGYARQGLYVPEGFGGKVPSHDELVRPSHTEYWTPSGFKIKPEYKSDKPTVFWTEAEHVGSLRIGAENRWIQILKQDIKKTTSINCNNVDMSDGHRLEELDKLKNLKILKLKNCGLTSLPKEIGELIHLEVLEISENPLEALPDFLGNLTALKQLSLPDKNTLNSKTYISEYLEGLPFLDDASQREISRHFLAKPPIRSLESL
jgi:Leucine-rich repeat (LRR) protein